MKQGVFVKRHRWVEMNGKYCVDCNLRYGQARDRCRPLITRKQLGLLPIDEKKFELPIDVYKRTGKYW